MSSLKEGGCGKSVPLPVSRRSGQFSMPGCRAPRTSAPLEEPSSRGGREKGRWRRRGDFSESVALGSLLEPFSCQLDGGLGIEVQVAADEAVFASPRRRREIPSSVQLDKTTFSSVFLLPSRRRDE